MMIRMVGGWVFLLVPAHPGSPGQRAIKRSLLLLQLWNMSVVETVPVSFWNGDVCYKLYLPFHQKSSGWSETMRSMGDFQWLASVLWIACSALILLIRAGSVLKMKPKPRFSVKTEPKPKPRFWLGPSQFWGRTRLGQKIWLTVWMTRILNSS